MNLGKNQFTVGIVDDVTFDSLPSARRFSLAKPRHVRGLFFRSGRRRYGELPTNSIQIIGGTTNFKYCQAYFSYDSKKSGGFPHHTCVSGDLPITSPYLVTTPDFVACHVPSSLRRAQRT